MQRAFVKQFPAWGRLARSGTTLVEVSMAFLILGLLILVVSQSIAWSTRTTVNTRKQIRAGRLADMILSRYKNIHFGYVRAVDSSQPGFGLGTGTWPRKVKSYPGSTSIASAFSSLTQQAGYPLLPVLSMLNQSVRSSGFTHYVAKITYMRRDPDGGALTPFQDANADGIDDSDPAIQWVDRNSDGDRFDFLLQDGVRLLTEEPNTHAKLVEVSVLGKGDVVFARRAELITFGQLTGRMATSPEAMNRVSFTQPTHGAVLLRISTPDQLASQALVLAKAYPPEPKAFSITPLIRFQGYTKPLATIRVGYGEPTSPITDSSTSDGSGAFDFTAPNLTTLLQEGENKVFLYSERGASRSANHRLPLLLDTKPPAFSNTTPDDGVDVRTRSPVVRVQFKDDTSLTASVSGIAPEVLSFLVDGSDRPFAYDPATGWATLVDNVTGLPPAFPNGTWVYWTVEGGDRARYKAKTATFSFRPHILPGLPPEILNLSPPNGGTASINPPNISCRLTDAQSGIDASSIVLVLDGLERVSAAATPRLADHFDPLSGLLSYRPLIPLSSGLHDVTVTVRHWHPGPGDESTVSWQFHVP